MKQTKFFYRSEYWTNAGFEKALNEFLAGVFVFDVQMSTTLKQITVMILYEGGRNLYGSNKEVGK